MNFTKWVAVHLMGLALAHTIWHHTFDAFVDEGLIRVIETSVKFVRIP